MTTADTKIGKLIITRHHESEWNKLGLWTGKRDVNVSPYGLEMAKKMGDSFNAYCTDAASQISHIDTVFLSAQKRTLQTYESMSKGITSVSLPATPERSAALNERDYGDYTGKNKWEVKKEVGDKAFELIRRGWDTPVPNGETLKMVYDRAVPYFLQTIVPLLKSGKNVLIVSSGNAIRALMKYIEHIPDDKIGSIEMSFGCILIYDVDADGHLIDKKILQVESKVNA
jgi:2,3-bisphosphoglycerate-dependent phosphoglycerate mutase